MEAGVGGGDERSAPKRGRWIGTQPTARVTRDIRMGDEWGGRDGERERQAVLYLFLVPSVITLEIQEEEGGCGGGSGQGDTLR